MNIYIDENILISKEDIIAVLDKEAILKTRDGKIFIKKYEENSLIHHIKGKVRSYILTFNKEQIKLYESNIASTSIKNKFKSKGLKALDD